MGYCHGRLFHFSSGTGSPGNPTAPICRTSASGAPTQLLVTVTESVGVDLGLRLVAWEHPSRGNTGCSCRSRSPRLRPAGSRVWTGSFQAPGRPLRRRKSGGAFLWRNTAALSGSAGLAFTLSAIPKGALHEHAGRPGQPVAPPEPRHSPGAQLCTLAACRRGPRIVVPGTGARAASRSCLAGGARRPPRVDP